jgi:hypothetical protein
MDLVSKEDKYQLREREKKKKKPPSSQERFPTARLWAGSQCCLFDFTGLHLLHGNWALIHVWREHSAALLLQSRFPGQSSLLVQPALSSKNRSQSQKSPLSKTLREVPSLCL